MPNRGGPKVLAIVLAGGEGKRLMPLTADRAKPAVPFGGIYRLIDFALSNLVNSDYLQIVVLTQYKSHSLDRHITTTWRMSSLLGNYVTPVPAQQRVGKNWYLGSADAIYQSLNLIYDEKPDYVVVVGADHVYRMDFADMVEAHIASGAKASVAAIRQPISLADQFGVIDVDPEDPSRIRAFLEKPTDPQGLPDSPDEVLASMGNYVFTAADLVDGDYGNVVDVVLLWWRDEDGDLVDGLVDSLTDLVGGGVIWLFTPKIGRPNAVDASDIAEAAPVAGLSTTTTTTVSKDWAATRLVAPKSVG